MTTERFEDVPLDDSMEVITTAADDFGHVIHAVPAQVAFPVNAGEVASLVRQVSASGADLVPRGAGHSVYGQAQSDGGIICDLTGLDSVVVEDSGAVRAEAGARWSAVLDAALARGLTPPVLPDYLELSIGGTLSVGGIGGASHQFGPVVDHIRELDVVTSDGELVTSSSGRNPDRFYAALGTGGSGGIIARAALPLVPAPERVRVYQIPFLSVGELVASQVKAAREGRLGYIEGQIVLGEDGDWQFIAELAVFSREGQPDGDPELDAVALGEDMSYRDFCYRMSPGVRLLAATGDWYRPHPWFSAFLPVDAVEEFVNSALLEMTAATVGPIPALLYPLRRGSAPVPGLPTPRERDDLFFSFSILRTTTEDAREAALESNARLAEAVHDSGGTVYRISAIPAAF